MTKNTPRQPSRSPTTPASDEPIRLPVMTAVSQRPIATWRSFTGTRSPITAMPTGKMPPPAMPATMRASEQHGEVGREPAHQHGEDRDREARDHDAHLADHVADRPEHRLHQRERQRERRGEQRDRVRIDLDVVRDRRNDRIGRARGERRDEADQAEPQDQAARCGGRPGASAQFRCLRSWAGNRRRSSGRNRIWAGNSWAPQEPYMISGRLCCAVRECLTRQSRGAGIARYSW